MEIEFLLGEQTNRSFGGGISTGLGNLLSVNSPGFGPAIRQINLTLALNGRVTLTQTQVEARRPPGADRFPMFQDGSAFPALAETASARFERQRQTLRLTWPSTRLGPNDVFMVFAPQLTRDLVMRAFDDILDGLEWAFNLRIKPSDDFDPAACMDWLREMRAQDYPSDDALRARLKAATDACRAHLDTLDPWEKLDIDWSKMHPKAREILNDPFYWLQGHEFSPHGNDAGADIFADWPRFGHLSPEQAGDYLDLPPLSTDLPDFLWKEWVDTHLALAFGHIKHSGTCPGPIAKQTRAILAAERANAAKRSTWEHREIWLKWLATYDRLLAGFDTA